MLIDRRSFLLLAGAGVAAQACGGVQKVPTPGVPEGPFDASSTADDVLEGIDLRGKLAVVTGCTSGIGLETMRALASRGAWVVGTSRSLAAATAACESVRGQTSPLQLELSDFDSVVRCANAIRSINAALDILICNAGYLGAGGRAELINGIERHFVINHLGHFVFVNRLLGRLYMADQGRIVVVASRASYTSAPAAGIEFDNLDAHRVGMISRCTSRAQKIWGSISPAAANTTAGITGTSASRASASVRFPSSRLRSVSR
jgi:WW domain-containing oxidoreductase